MEDIIKGWRTRGSFGISSLWLGTNPTPSWKKKKRQRLRGQGFPWGGRSSTLGAEPWAGSWLGCSCEEAVGSVLPGVSTQLQWTSPASAGQGLHCVRGAARSCRSQRHAVIAKERESLLLSKIPLLALLPVGKSWKAGSACIRCCPTKPPSPSLLSHRGAAAPASCKAFLGVLRWGFHFVPLRGHLCCSVKKQLFSQLCPMTLHQLGWNEVLKDQLIQIITVLRVRAAWIWQVKAAGLQKRARYDIFVKSLLCSEVEFL